MLKRMFLFVVFISSIAASGNAADFTNFIGMEFSTIPSGFFYMGSCNPADGKTEKKTGLFGLGSNSVCPSGGMADTAAEPDELPQHKVEITRPFQLAIFEVTRAQFKAFAKDNHKTVSVSFDKYNSHGDTAAVVWVSWYQAQEFIDWLNRAKPADDRGLYRLPTEAEWEYAARAGTTGAYFFGEKSLQISRFAWIIKESQSFGQIWSRPVGIKQPNPWGLYDIYGNVWEWVQDIYDEQYYQKSPEQNPTGPDSGPNQVVRGCSLYSSAKNCRSAKRHYLAADQRDGTVGFRVARELP